jgi:DNA-binding GntR family transcriptional regulator
MDKSTFQTASEVAYEIIAKKIIDGEYKPGMKLSRRKMAEATGVSVIPVIEALKKLEENYLVESKPQWGSFVTTPTKERIIKMYEVREALECQIARILSKKITKEQIDRVMPIATYLDVTPYDETNKEKLRDEHMEFHLSLARFTGNEYLVQSLEKINLFWILCSALNARAKSAKYPRYWHRKLIEDIISGDENRAENSMREHVRDSLIPIMEDYEHASL